MSTHETFKVGEFDTHNYAIPKGVQTDPAPILERAGFVNTKLKGNMLWVNPTHKRVYLKNPQSFGCHRVHDVKVDLTLLINFFKKL